MIWITFQKGFQQFIRPEDCHLPAGQPLSIWDFTMFLWADTGYGHDLRTWIQEQAEAHGPIVSIDWVKDRPRYTPEGNYCSICDVHSQWCPHIKEPVSFYRPANAGQLHRTV